MVEAPSGRRQGCKSELTAREWDAQNESMVRTWVKGKHSRVLEGKGDRIEQGNLGWPDWIRFFPG